MTRARAVAVYAPTSRGFAAVVHATRGGLEAPAGSVEPGERLAEAAARELFEETGLRAGALRRLGSVASPSGGACAVFLATGVRGRLRGSLEGRAIWVDVVHLLGPDATFPRQNEVAIGRILARNRSLR